MLVLRCCKIVHEQVQAPQQAGSVGRGMMQVPVQPVSGGAPTLKAATPQLQQQQLAQVWLTHSCGKQRARYLKQCLTLVLTVEPNTGLC